MRGENEGQNELWNQVINPKNKFEKHLLMIDSVLSLISVFKLALLR